MAEREFAASVPTIPEVIEYVSDAAASWGLHPKRVMQLQLAVEEAFVNICEYAYKVPPGVVVVRIEPGGTRFTVELVDEGQPFDPLEVAEPDLHADSLDRPLGGLGIFLVRRVMDEVSYKRVGGKNVLTLVVFRQS
jgi:serine/threonine-protein kinase RsbW